MTARFSGDAQTCNLSLISSKEPKRCLIGGEEVVGRRRKTAVGGGWSAVLVLETVSCLWRSWKKRGGGFTDDVRVFVGKKFCWVLLVIFNV
ncbi:hypothetical protein Hanom_Chr04g00316511 [Helianthus anomalus]